MGKRILSLPFLPRQPKYPLADSPSVLGFPYWFPRPPAIINLCKTRTDVKISILGENGNALGPNFLVNLSQVKKLTVIKRDCVGSNAQTQNNGFSDIFENDVDEFETTKTEKIISITYQNCDGLKCATSEKFEGLKAMTSDDTLSCFSETNFKNSDAALFVNEKIGEYVTVKSQDKVTYKNGKRVELVGTTKRSGFGTAACIKNADSFEFHHSSKDFEIIACDFSRYSLQILTLACYRSPSMKDSVEIEDFYSEVGKIVDTLSSCNDYDVVIFVGDDNSSDMGRGAPSTLAWEVLNAEMKVRNMKNKLVGKKTRKNRCPDSLFVKFDSKTCDVDISIWNSWIASDHKAIRISIKPGGFSYVKDVSTKFKKQSFMTKVMGNKRASEILQKQVTNFCNNHNQILDLHKKSLKDSSIPFILTPRYVDNATYDFLAMIKFLKSLMFKRVVKNIHVDSYYYDSPTKTRLDYIKFKMKKLYDASDKFSDDKDKMTSILEKMASLDQRC